MKRSESNSVYECVKPLYYTSKFAGLWPQTLRRSSPGITLISLVYNFFVLGLYFYVFYQNIFLELYDQFYQLTNSVVFMYLTKLQMLANLVLSIISVVFAMVHHKKLWDILDKFDEINAILEKDFIFPLNYANIKRVNYIMATINHAILTILLIISWLYYEKVIHLSSYVIYLSQYMGNLPQLSLFGQYMLCIFFVKRRFDLINDLLGQMVTAEKKQPKPPEFISFAENLKVFQRDFPLTMKHKNEESSRICGIFPRSLKPVSKCNFETLNVPELIEKITILAKIHDYLCDCMELINKVYSIPTLLIFMTMYIFNLFGYFSCYRAFFDGHQEISIITAFTNALWISYYLGMKCVIIHMSHSMTRAGKYTGVIIHRIINSTNDKILLGKLSTISEQILTSNPVFNCGLFTFDWSLMYTMVVSTTAYLAFLIQFDIPLL